MKILMTLITVLTINMCAAWANADSLRYCAGIVYGPTAAFQIDAPEGWVLDNKSGASSGLHCVLYPLGQTWAGSPVVMYASLAAANHTDINKFIQFAVNEFEQESPEFKHSQKKRGKVGEHEYVIMDYSGGIYKNFERVLYVQMEGAVAYVVFSSRSAAEFAKYADALLELTETFISQPDFINYEPKQ